MSATPRRWLPARWLIPAVFPLVACAGSVGPETAGEGRGGETPGQPGNMTGTDGTGATQPGGKGTAPGGGGTGTTGGGTMGGGAGAAGGAGTPACTSTTPNVGLTPLRRLTRDQYVNTVRDLLGGAKISRDLLSPDEQIGPFQTNLVGTVSDLLGQQYMEAAETLAKASMPKLESLVLCDRAKLGDGACADQFIDKFGLRAYRRPLSADEKMRYKAAYTAYVGQGGHVNGLRVVVQVMLQSPSFLYQVETGGMPGAVAPLEPFALASRLSYFLWSSMPDDTLLAAAAANQLGDAKAVRAQVDRMLKDPKARDTLASFHQQWLGLVGFTQISKDTKVYPAFTPELRTAMDNETVAFVDQVLRKGDGKLSTLFTAPYTVTNDANLLKLYGATAAPGADGTVPLPAGQRAGLLTQAGFIAGHSGTNQSSPVKRGVVVIKNLLCVDLPDPPDGVVAKAPDPSKDATTRERFAQHEKDPACAGCHKLIDGIGLGFENYDGIGAFRAQENGKAIDASGEVLTGGTDLRGTFTGAVDLARKMAGSADVQLCTTRQWMRFALGRGETDADACSLQAALGAFKGAQLDVRELIAVLATSDAFRYRRVGK